METFPVAPELMQAFPLGALSALLAVASTVAAQHGVDHARYVCRELAANDALWAFIAERVLGGVKVPDAVAPDTERGMTPLPEPRALRSGHSPPRSAAPLDGVSVELGSDALGTPARPPRKRSRRSAKANGAGE